MLPGNFAFNCRRVLLIAVLAGLGMVSQVSAQLDPETRPPTHELLPETTVAFVQVDNFRDLITKMQESSMGQMMQEEEIANLTAGLWDETKAAYEDVKDEVGLEVDDLVGLPAGEMTFAVIAPRRKDPEFMMILELNEENDGLDRVLDRARQAINEDGEEITTDDADEDGIEYESFNAEGKRVKFFRMGGLLVGSTSEDELDAFVDRWAGREVEKVRPLTENRKFVTIMNRCLGSKDIKPEARFFVDPIALAKSATRGDVGSQVAINLLPVLGLDGLLGVGGSMILSEDDFESIVHGHVLLASPKTGLFEMLALKPTSYEPEPWLPSDAVSYMTTSWDIDQMIAELTKMIETFQGEGKVDEWIENNINAEIDLDLKEDVLGLLTGRVTYVQWMEPPLKLNSQVNVISLEIKDDKLAEFELALEAIIDRVNRDEEDGEEGIEETDYNGIRIWQQPAAVMENRLERRRERRAERRAERGEEEDDFQADVNIPQPAFALIGNHLVISPQSAKFIRHAIDTDQGDFESMVSDPKFATISKKMTRLLKDDSPCGMIYSNPEESMRMMFELANSEGAKALMTRGAEDNPYVAGFRDRLEQNPLPDFEKVRKYFKPAGGYMLSDDTGYHMLIFNMRNDVNEDDE